MRKYSPNLKPNSTHNHSDAAEQLGVPTANIVDLRAFNPEPLAKDLVVPLEVEPTPTTLVQPVVIANDTPAADPITAEPLPEVKALEPTEQLNSVEVIEALVVEPTPAPIPEEAKLRTPKVKRWNIHFAWKPAVAFAVMASLAVIPATTIALWQRAGTAAEDIRLLTGEAADHFQSGATATSELQFDEAATSFADAQTSFALAQDELHHVNTTLAPVLEALPSKGNPYVSADNLLIAGEQIAAAGQDLVYAFTLIEELAKQTGGEQPAELFVAAHSVLRPIVPRLERASLALQDVDLETIPEEYRDTVQTAQTSVPLITGSMEELLSLSESLVTLLGHDEAKRYLVLFQNNREMRATGGFIGSFALVDMTDGRVSGIEIPGGGPYDLMGSLTEQVIAPQPMHLVNSKWQMQDANWWPDFPTSAQKVQWFYEHSGGPSVDGVITLTPEIIEQMLEITGPIEMPEYGSTVTAENFYEITQTQAERKYDDTRESKKFIADLTPRMLDRLFSVDAKTLLPMMQVVYDALQQKDILVYFNDPFLQHEFSAEGWTGEVKETTGDYLQVVDTNIGGGKTDAAIQSTIQHTASIDADGSVIDTVVLTRLHTGASDDIFANTKNVDYVRVYVPEGSTLLSAEGFSQPDPNSFLPVEAGYEQDEDLQAITGEVAIDSKTQTRINTEFGKTVFGNWIQTEPGKSSTVTLRYRLPFRVTRTNWNPGRYSLFVQKQPGAFDPIILTQVDYPKSWNLVWSYPNADLSLEDTLTTDRYLGAVFE